MARRFDVYQVKRDDNLAAAAFWNSRFLDIDLRLAAREDDSTRIDDAVDQLVAIALARMDDTFTPLIIDAQQRLNQLGASFSAESLSSATISTGAKDFTLTPETAANYVYTDYVTLRAAVAQTNLMTASVVGFNRETGILSVNVVAVEGSGTFNDWLIRIGTPPDASGHASRTDNPHSTTAAQVGAYTTAQTDALLAALQATIPSLAGDMFKADNLSGLTNYTTARSNLGLLSMAQRNAPSLATLTDAAPVNWAFTPTAPIQFAQLTLGGNRLIANPTNLQACTFYLIIKQDGTGNRVPTWGSAWRFPGSVAPLLSTGANAIDIVTGICDGTLLYGTYLNSLGSV